MPGNRLDNGITLRHAFDTLRGPPLSSPFRELRELTERMHAGADPRMPDVHAPPQHAPAPTARRGRPEYDWPRITQLDAENRRTHYAATDRAPTWKERHTALTQQLGRATPHVKTLEKRLRSRR